MRSGLSDRDLDTPGSPGCLPGLRPVLCRDDRFFAGFLPHGASVDGGREEFEESVPNCRSSSAIRLLCWATVASSSGQMAPCQVMAPVSGTRHQAGTGAELRHCRNSRRARAGVVQTAWPSFLDSCRPQPVTQVQPAGCTHLGRDDQASLVSEYESDIIATAWRTGELGVIGQGGAAVNPSSGRARRRACWPSAPGHRRAACGRRVGRPARPSP